MPRPAAVAARAASTVVLVTALAGCGGAAGEASRGCAEPVPVAKSRLAALPLDLDEVGTVTEVGSEAGHLAVTVVAESTIDESYAALPAVLTAGGFDVVAEENEGIEADIFFVRGRRETGSVKLVEGPCEGQVTLRLTVASTPSR
ncbi:hypothetical protein [Actinomadura sp. HBU206391]|uniref:hypothetical protein n=1 Tax=Actinomadura sp. HBU206391 TaxID=2731692 RepID=UPI00164F899F|nr:hypothetical protein [Actinomadura sp. HBU206391]MBC6460444.1 hypothetical protein [Actinomadura sp. HBU206391]